MCPAPNENKDGCMEVALTYSVMKRPESEYLPPYGPTNMMAILARTTDSCQVWVSHANWYAAWLCVFNASAPLLDNILEWIDKHTRPYHGERKQKLLLDSLDDMFSDTDPIVVMPATRPLLALPMFQAISGSCNLACMPVVIQPKVGFPELIPVPIPSAWFDIADDEQAISLMDVANDDVVDEDDEDEEDTDTNDPFG